MNKIIIIGAGLTGSTVARVLAENGKEVLVIERLNHIAGHCHDYKNEDNITVHSYGPHIFHTNDKKAWDFLNRFADFHYYQHKVLTYVEGKLLNFPINRDTLCELYGVSISTNEVKDFLQKEVDQSKYNTPQKNFRDTVVSQVGEKLYDLFFKNYTIKQWQKDPKELSPDIAKRIPIRENRDNRYFSDKYQGIPSKGYTEMIRKMLDHPNISLMLNTDYFDIKDSFMSELIVYTGELDRFFNYELGKLEYRSLELEFRTFEKDFFQPVATVNYPNDYDWTRITEFKHFLNETSEKTTVCFEYPKAEGEPYYVVLTKDNIKKREQYMRKANELEKKGKHIFIGRLAEYKYYNMDQVVSTAINRISKWLEK